LLNFTECIVPTYGPAILSTLDTLRFDLHSSAFTEKAKMSIARIFFHHEKIPLKDFA
jgi:hypothetical protein